MYAQRNSISTRFNKQIKGLTTEFYWIFLPSGVYINLHDEKKYSDYLDTNYESVSNKYL